MPFGIYLHIPFCSSFCSYCDFYRVHHTRELESEFVAALQREIELRSKETKLPRCTSLYFGGGTPSLLHKDAWRNIFAAVRDNLEIMPDCEITVEANPDSADPEKLALLRELGVNRLSLGAQSFSDKALRLLGRRHDAAGVLRAVAAARHVGFGNLSLDLLLGLPISAGVRLRDDLTALLDLAPEHLSCYALTLEGGVPLELAVERREQTLPEDDQIAADYLDMVSLLRDAEMLQYEISNFARTGSECSHNLNYWQQVDYLGFGPSAVSTLYGTRISNEPDLKTYTSALHKRTLPPRQEEALTRRTLLAERIMLSLRQTGGLDLERLKRDFSYDLLESSGELVEALRNAGDLTHRDNRIRLTPRGMLRYNLIVADLLPE